MLFLGIMSGTSLDGIDLALCSFDSDNSFKIHKAQTIPYTEFWRKSLSEAQNLPTQKFLILHKQYGKFIGETSKRFLSGIKEKVVVASHGHTIFHQPEKNFTFQIGDGAFIAAEAQTTVVCDFRNLDTALGGQGAPLVPVGDKMLFSDFKYCINIGGFANISFDNEKGERIAFDICPANFISNILAERLGFEYDHNGNFGQKGNVFTELLNKLNAFEYYKVIKPKSLAREDVEKKYLPLIDSFEISTEDKIRTLYEHIAYQISEICNKTQNNKVLITGGGAKNAFLVSLIKKMNENEIIIPENKIIDFKEALIFAFLGYLRLNNKINCLSSVTGAKYSNIGGAVYEEGIKA